MYCIIFTLYLDSLFSVNRARSSLRCLVAIIFLDVATVAVQKLNNINISVVQ